MSVSVQIRTPMPSAEEVLDSLNLSAKRRRFLEQLAVGPVNGHVRAVKKSVAKRTARKAAAKK